MNRKRCVGCRDDYYNSNGNACWCLESARLVKARLVHVNDVPPWTHKPRMLPHCYRKPQYVKVLVEETKR